MSKEKPTSPFKMMEKDIMNAFIAFGVISTVLSMTNPGANGETDPKIERCLEAILKVLQNGAFAIRAVNDYEGFLEEAGLTDE